MSNVAQLYLNDKDLNERWSQVKSDFWGDLKKETSLAISNLLTTSMEIQVQDLIGSDKWQHNYQRPNYRNGYRYRNLLTSFGYLTRIKVPRIRSGNIRFNCIPYYKQRTQDIDKMTLEMFLAGVSTRRVEEVFIPLLGYRSISSSTVSTITKRLNEQVNKYHARLLSDDYVYLIVDGVYFNVKNPVYKKRRCVLVVYGIKSNGIRELIDFEIAPNGESERAWENFLNRLYHRGLKGNSLRLVIRDGNKGLKNALNTIFPNLKQQPCWAHKLRNIAGYLPKRLIEPCINQARDIYSANSKYDALKAYRSWVDFWYPSYPKAVDCLNKDIDDLLNFFNEPKHLWRKIRTTNIIERAFREVRRRTRPMSCFQNQYSVQRIIFAIFYRLNKIWEKKPLKVTHKLLH
jgi:transposase-like protein